jgi:uncharacterized protein
MLYLDTSAVVPLCHKESTTAAVIAVLAVYPDEEISVSDWTITEFYSAIGSLVRDRKLSVKEADTALDKLLKRLSQGLITYQLDADDQILAQSFMRNWKNVPKGSDALHIAAARRLNAQLITIDKAMARHAASNAVQYTLVKS